MRKFLALFVILLALSTGGVVMAQSTATPLAPGAYEFFCGTGRLRHSFVDGNVNLVRLNCTTNGEGVPLPTPTETPVNTPAPTETPVVQPTETNTPAPTNMIDMYWHPPMAHGDRPRHEHGDPPPSWLLDYFGATETGEVMLFQHSGNTPGENIAAYKHTAFKGWAGRFNGQDWYGVFHLDFQPNGRQNRFHSYQLWVRDSSGEVSAINGWLDFGTGNNTGPQVVETCGQDSGIRPIMLVSLPGCPVRFENWYASAGGNGGWAPDFGFNINPNYFSGGDPENPATWNPTGGIRNVERRIEFAWYLGGNGIRPSPRGEFYATQWGDIVSGPNDPVCGTQRSYGSRSYTVLCLRQYVSPALQPMTFPGNSVQRTFNSDGVMLPN